VLAGFPPFLKLHTSLFWRLYAHAWCKNEGVVTFSLTFCPHPLNIRLNTSDASVFKETFLDKAYDLSFLNLNPKVIIDGGANIGFVSIFLHLLIRRPTFSPLNLKKLTSKCFLET
jgi:hypothetical protein